MPNKAPQNDQLVVAIFADTTAANQAMKGLEQWEKTTKTGKLGGYCVVSKGATGRLEYHQHKVHAAVKGARLGLTVGAVVGAAAFAVPVLAVGGVAAGAALIGGSAITALGEGVGTGAIVTLGALANGLSGGAIGAAAGGIAGGITKDRWGFNDSEIGEVGQQLAAGKAALMVMVDDAEIAPISQELQRLDGTIINVAVPEKLQQHVDAAIQEGVQSGALSQTPPPSDMAASSQPTA